MCIIAKLALFPTSTRPTTTSPLAFSFELLSLNSGVNQQTCSLLNYIISLVSSHLMSCYCQAVSNKRWNDAILHGAAKHDVVCQMHLASRYC